VEAQFVRPMHLGDTVLSYRTLEPLLAVLPWDGERMLDGADPRLDQYPGLAKWWRQAERVWMTNRSSERLSLLERVDFRRGASQQFPSPPQRVVYTKGGMYLAAARVEDSTAVIDHKLYWAAVSTVDEARYLTAVLNSAILGKLVRPLQARGEHNPRDFDKYVFQVGIPLFDASDEHMQLAALAEQAESLAAGVELPAGRRFELYRRLIRQALAESDVGKAIEVQVATLLTPAAAELGLDASELLAEPIEPDGVDEDLGAG
jgi:hypothetical protein